MRALACTLLFASLTLAQSIDIRLDHLKAKAKESTSIDLDGVVLAAFSRELSATVKAVHIHSFEFENEGGYTPDDVESILKQVRGNPGWSRALKIRERHESVDVFVMMKGNRVQGFLFLAAEPRELTVIHIAGALTLEQARDLVDHHLDM